MMAAENPITPIHPGLPGRPVLEEGDGRQRHPRRRPERKEPEDSGDDEQDKGGQTPGPPKDQDPDHIDEYA